MNKNILVISTSLRKDSNSEVMAREFARGAEQGGNQVEIISLNKKEIGFCIGCLSCQSTGACVIEDDVAEIAEKMLVADSVAFATPIYFYEMSGQMKTLLDRLNPLFSKEYKFRDIYLLAAAADGNDRAMDGAVNGLQGFIDCFEEAKLAGVVRGTELEASNDILAERAETHLQAAYTMGMEV